MLKYAPELIAAVRYDYLHSDATLVEIAAKFNINERDITRMRAHEGWPGRYARIRRVPRIPQLPAAAQTSEAQTAGRPSDPLRSGGNEESALTDLQRVHDGCASPLAALIDSAVPELPPNASLIDRIERLVEQELRGEERERAQLGPARRRGADAVRFARTIATLTQALQALKRLRGASEQGPCNEHDLPADPDEARDELARRVEAFLASREAEEGADSATGVTRVARE